VGGADVASYLLQDAGKFPPKDHSLTAPMMNEHEHTYESGSKIESTRSDQSRSDGNNDRMIVNNSNNNNGTKQ